MPRLPPQFNGTPAVIELRQTQGTWERDLEKKKLEIEKVKSYSNALNNLVLPVGVIAIGAGIGLGGYFLARGITSIAQAWNGEPIDNILDEANKIFKGSRGQNSDGSIPTLLCVTGKREGQVIVNTGIGSDWYIAGGLSGAFFNWIGAQRSKNIPGEEWVPIWGNFNKNAKTISDLTPGWLYLNDLEGGSSAVTDDYAYQGGDNWQEQQDWPTEEEIRAMGPHGTGAYRFEDFVDTSGVYESAWGINGWTYEEWIAMAIPPFREGPITDAWIEYMQAHPDRFDEATIEYFINLKAAQEAWADYVAPTGQGDIPDIEWPEPPGGWPTNGDEENGAESS